MSTFYISQIRSPFYNFHEYREKSGEIFLSLSKLNMRTVTAAISMSPITTLTTKMLPSKSPTLKLILFSRSRECLTRYSHRVTHSQKCSSVMSHHSTIILKLRLKRENRSGFLVRDHIQNDGSYKMDQNGLIGT